MERSENKEIHKKIEKEMLKRRENKEIYTRKDKRK